MQLATAQSLSQIGFMKQLDIFSSAPKTEREWMNEIYEQRKQSLDRSLRVSQTIRDLQNKWGGFWKAKFIDGHSCFAPGFWVYLLGGIPLIIARVEAQPGCADRARLTCIRAIESIESILLLHDLTDDFVTKHKPQVLSPAVLYSDRHAAILAAQGLRKSKAKSKPWKELELRAFVQQYLANEFDGIAHQAISIAKSYKDDSMERKTINELHESVQMQLMVSGRAFDPDDLLGVFFEVIDQIATLPEMSIQFAFK